MNILPPRLIDRLRSLKSRHRQLEHRIADELKRPKPDGLRVQTLKKMRLRAKDQIALISGKLATASDPQRPTAA